MSASDLPPSDARFAGASLPAPAGSALFPRDSQRQRERQAVSPGAAAQNAQSQVLGALNGPERAAFEAIEPEVRQHLERIADTIEMCEDGVVARWRRRASSDLLLASSPAWSRRQFEDHIPDSVVVLGDALRSWPSTTRQYSQERRAARAHSQHRWQQSYDLRSLTREWGHLNACLLEELDDFWSEGQSATMHQALRVARSLVATMILESSSESVSEFARLLQTEASTRARQMERAIDALQHQEKQRGQVLREAAHDLRGSLGIISGSASLIDSHTINQDDRDEVGRILRRGVSSLREMMTDLIDLARLEAGEENLSARPFDASQMMQELGATLLPLAQAKGLALVVEGPGTLPVWGDEVKVRRVAQNLLLNAIKYTHEGHVSLAWAPHGERRWMLRVADTGPGLSHARADSLAHAMHEATTTARQVEGRTEGEQNTIESPQSRPLSSQAPSSDGQAPPPSTCTQDSAPEDSAGSPLAQAGEGVGLSIVKRLCDLMGASIELDAQDGQGSTFRILFARDPATSHVHLLRDEAPAKPTQPTE